VGTVSKSSSRVLSEEETLQIKGRRQIKLIKISERFTKSAPGRRFLFNLLIVRVLSILGPFRL
jgi:hypothetical protein